MKTFIWDLDGTLVDSYEFITRHVHAVFSDYLELSKDEIFNLITDTSIRSFFIETAKEKNLDLKKLYENYMALESSVLPSDYKLIDGTTEVLSKLEDHQHFIYTHRGHSTYEIIEENHISKYFIEVVTSDNGFERKPSGQALNYLVNKYQLDKENTYYIGDRLLDVLCANDAGVISVYYNPLDKKLDQAKLNINSLLDLLLIEGV